MAIRMEKNKTLFSRIQTLAFLPQLERPSKPETFLDVESQQLLSRVKGNIQRLSETSMKMDFMLDEIQSVIRRRF